MIGRFLPPVLLFLAAFFLLWAVTNGIGLEGGTYD